MTNKTTDDLNLVNSYKYDYLNSSNINKDFIVYSGNNLNRVLFYIPKIHCSSCIQFLENLSKIEKNILNCSVDFINKKVDITYDNSMRLSDLAIMLTKYGFPPDLSGQKHLSNKKDKSAIYRIGVSGFCFGNIMLLYLLEYLGINNSFEVFKGFFVNTSLILSLPVVLYASRLYYINAWKGIRDSNFNMDIPIALGISALFLRSLFEVITNSGIGYFDSLAGFVFFLSLGKWVQQKTFDNLLFDRDYKSYFPIAVNKIINNTAKPIKISELNVGDTIEVRNEELIPADSILIAGSAVIDYSFVTGEAGLAHLSIGDVIYAGGRQKGKKILLSITKQVNNSYLTSLWNHDVFKKEDHEYLSAFTSKLSRYFTIIVLSIAFITGIYWFYVDKSILWNAVSAVLIVACPCALALSTPFTFGNILRIMGKNQIFLKDSKLIEVLSKITDIVFDKTGTMTYSDKMDVEYFGRAMTDGELSIIKSLISNSAHPLSIAIHENLKIIIDDLKVSLYEEIAGKGIKANICGYDVKIGSKEFIDPENSLDISPTSVSGSRVFATINNSFVGFFCVKQLYRKGLNNLLDTLRNKYNLHLISGDTNSQEVFIKNEFKFDYMEFQRSPLEKLNYIEKLQKKGSSVLMIGDGLNDAGALKKSDIGIAVTNEIHQFTPSCDIIISANSLNKLVSVLKLSIKGMTIVKISIIISAVYNIVGLAFAVSGLLSPIIAAILMPLSSISVVGFTVISTSYYADRLNLK